MAAVAGARRATSRTAPRGRAAARTSPNAGVAGARAAAVATMAVCMLTLPCHLLAAGAPRQRPGAPPRRNVVMQPDPHILGHGPEAAIQHEPVKGDTEWKVSPGSFDAQEKLMNMRTDKIRGMIDHEHVLQGLSFGGMTISGVARNKQLSCYKPDSFPGNLEPIVMTADGLPAPDQLETAEVGPDGSVSHHIPVFKGDSVEDALAHVLSRCAKLEECASVGIDAHPHCPRAGADTQPYALLHVTYCTGDLHTLHVQLMDAMDNMAMFPEEEEGDPVFGASPHDDRHEHDGPSSRCEAAGVAAWDIWEPMALEVCGSASVPCQSPHDRCHWGVDDHPLPWRMHGRGWSGPQCIRHLVKAHRHGEAEAVEDVDALLPDIVPRERVYASVVDLGVVPEVVRDFGVHNANLSAVYGTAAYPIRVTHDGVRLEPTDAIQAPTMSFVAEQGRYYALAMVDPDAPSRQDPRFRAWVRLVCAQQPAAVAVSWRACCGTADACCAWRAC